MAKSRDAFRTISEVASWLDTPAHVLRFWESKFTQVKPVKRAGGRRYYRPDDMRLLGGIKKLLHKDGMTIKGAQQILRDQGIEHVAAMSIPLDVDAPSDTASSEKPAKAEVKPKTDKATAADAPAAPEATTTAETVPEQPETAPSEAVSEVEATDDTVSDAAQSTADEAQKAP
ncbi:MAG: MerR family transcriptional regulator, partial [Paracoccaceae bacterium]|nr:MerR family transcriptional regulator [Paracoccaceae bacterium]